MLGLLNTVLSKGNTLLTYVKDGLVMANRFLTPPKLTFPVDASAEFNGTSDYIDTGAQRIQNTHSVSAWVYFEGTSNGQVVCSRDSGSDGLYLLMTSNKYPYYRINNSTITTSTAYANEWVYLSATYDGTNQKLYINGSIAGSATTSQTISVGNNTTIARSSISAAEYLKGNLANVAIWNRALTSDEINSVMWKTYEQVSTTESNGLQAWYKLSADEVLSDDSTATLTTYANANALTFEAPACVQTALNGLPDITDARLYSANYDIRVSADGGNVESLSCVETELNAIL